MACTALLPEILEALAAPVDISSGDAGSLPAVALTGVSTDSRTILPGALFVALVGDSFDGHGFVDKAQARGAVAAIVSRSLPLDIPQIIVEDTLAAYQAIARWWRQQCSAKVIAVTGSVGKTTTKELIAAVLATAGQVLKTQANYNNEIGVPKTLLELTPEHDYAVVEMGMRGQGEIALLSQIAQPDVAVITNVGTAHIERLGSEEAIAAAKCELLAEMPSTSVAVLNADDARLRRVAATVWSGKTVTYGLEQGDVQGRLGADGLTVGNQRFEPPLPGRHHSLNFLAALAVAQILQVDWTPLQSGLQVVLPAGRAQRYLLPNDIVLLDETYNAGVESMVAALGVLAETPGERRIAVLGTMKELGDHSVALHHRVGEAVRQLGIDQLLILADPAERQALATGAAPVPPQWFESHSALIDHLMALLRPGDRVLFKASRAVELDVAVAQVRHQIAKRAVQ